MNTFHNHAKRMHIRRQRPKKNREMKMFILMRQSYEQIISFKIDSSSIVFTVLKIFLFISFVKCDIKSMQG